MNPTRIVAGDAVIWTEDVKDATAAIHKFDRQGFGEMIGVSITGDIVDGVATFAMTAEQTAHLVPGWQRSLIELDGTTERRPSMFVEAEPGASPASFATRMADLLEKALEEDAGEGLESHTIGGASFAKMSYAEKVAMWEKFKGRRDRENADRAGTRRLIRGRFTGY